MKITTKTPTKSVLPLLNDERVQQILDAVKPYPLECPVLDMTLGEFAECSSEAYVAELLKEPLAFKAFGRVKELKIELEQVQKYLEKSEIKPTADEQNAAAGVEFPSGIERMVIDAIRWGLCNPKEGEDMADAAERVRLTTWILFQKDKAASAAFERRMQAIYTAKSKTKK